MIRRHVLVSFVAIAGYLGPLAAGTSPTTLRAQPAPQPFNTGMGDLMNTYIQPRHVKLGLAIRNENWPLADYALHELKQSLRKVGQARPQFRKLSVPDMIEASTSEPIRNMEQAVKARDVRQLTEGFAKLTAGCNSCHASTNHGFVAIKVPTEAAFPNQDFQPAH